MMLLVTIAVLSLALQLLLTSVVLLRDTKALRNRAFTLLSAALAFWAALTFAFDVFPDIAQNIYTVRATMFFVVLQNCFFPLFTFSLLRLPLVYDKKLIAYIALSIITASLMLLTPAMFLELTTSAQGEVYPVAQPGMALFVVHAAISITSGFRFLIRRLRQTHTARHQQLMYILFGSIVLWGIVPITNFALSISLQSTFYARYTPLFTLIFSSLIVYAIIKHRLFDIKRAAVRAVAYFLAIGTVVALYGVSFVLGITQVFGFGKLTLETQLVLFGFAIVIGLSIPPLVRFFDGITQQLFFRKAYDSQRAIDEMTDIFVQADTLKELLGDSASALMKILGSDSLSVSLTHVDGAGQRLAYTSLPAQAEHPMPILTQAHMLAASTRVVSIDELGDAEEDMVNEMNTMNIAIVSQLRSPVGVVGYLMFGYRGNGTHYGRQDLDFIDIVSNEFAIAIQSELRFEEIKAFNAELQRKIDEATRELKASNRKLQQLDEAKDEFISMASHQLRTPLTTVKGYLSMVLEGDVGKVEPAQKKVLEEAYDSAQRMVFLIGDFLNVSRLQTGKFIMEWASADLSKIISQEISQLKAGAAARKLKLVYEAPTSFPEMTVDETKLRQVMMNFIDNAIYYSKPDTTIDISLMKLADEVVFKVTDHGIGVPMSERQRLFTKFYRASNAKKQRPDGTGIGLFMAKKVIVAHGGSVIFESKEGQGSTFGFRLPLKNDLQQLEQQPDEDE